jgi:hypothetical protein
MVLRGMDCDTSPTLFPSWRILLSDLFFGPGFTTTRLTTGRASTCKVGDA